MSLPSGILQRLAGVLISICLIACPVLAQSLEVIDLKYRTAAEVIPVLQPLVEQGGALTGQDYKLFVRASPANLRQLRAALEQIDRKPNQLLVSVRRSTEQEVATRARSSERHSEQSRLQRVGSGDGLECCAIAAAVSRAFKSSKATRRSSAAAATFRSSPQSQRVWDVVHLPPRRPAIET